MKSHPYAKIREVLAANPEDAPLLKDAGLIGEDEVEDLNAKEAIEPLAAKYYDLGGIKKTLLEELSEVNLKDIAFETGRYQIDYDFLGSLEPALRMFGLAEVGIEETDTGYKLGEQEVGSIDELADAKKVLQDYADKVATDLNDKLELPGAFFFAFDSEYGDDAFRLFYAFEDADIPELNELGAQIEVPEVAEASFDQILAALEDEGLHDMARRLHSILREH
jgi:hypothetical protein